jgi:hypothetical protein
VVETGADFFEPYQDLFAVIGQGNHECYDDQTEILTEHGWKLFRDLDQTEKVATLNLGSNVVEWQLPYNYHTSFFSGKMHKVRSRGADWVVTPNHRIVYRPQKSDKCQVKESKDFSWSKGSCVTVPVSGQSGNPDLQTVSDDELRLLGWVLSDGSIGTRHREGRAPYNYVYIYQSDKYHIIKSLLDRMNADYNLSERERFTEAIGDVILKRKTNKAYTFTLKREIKKRIIELLDNKTSKHLPSWMYSLSDRQFEVFLKEYIKGDGSIHPSAPSSWMITSHSSTSRSPTIGPIPPNPRSFAT